jgi:branched-chain amino acid transport system permease protein
MMQENLFNQVYKKWLQVSSKPGFNKGAMIALLIFVLALGRLVTNTYWIRVFDTAGIYVMLALGLNVVLGYTGLLNMGFAGYFAIGAYMWALLASPQHGLHWPFWVVFPLAGLVTGFVGYLLSLPIKDLRGDYFAVVTIGLGEIVRILANNLPVTNAALGIIKIDPIDLGFYKLTSDYDYYYFLVAVIVLIIIVMKRLENSYIGTAWMAIREDEVAAKAMGVNTRAMKLLACFIGAIPAGLAGVIFAAIQTYVNPISFRMSESVAIIAMVMVGGRGNVAGVVLGALMLTILPEPLRGTDLDGARILLYGLLLIVVAGYRPQGILPRRYGSRSNDSKKAAALPEVPKSVEVLK